MTRSFRAWGVDETWLLPPSVQDFVPARLPAHLVGDIVREKSDLGVMLSTYTEVAAGLRKTRHRGLARVGWVVTLTAAACNLVRLPKLLADTA